MERTSALGTVERDRVATAATPLSAWSWLSFTYLSPASLVGREAHMC